MRKYLRLEVVSKARRGAPTKTPKTPFIPWFLVPHTPSIQPGPGMSVCGTMYVMWERHFVAARAVSPHLWFYSHFHFTYRIADGAAF